MTTLFPKWTNRLPLYLAVGAVVGLLFTVWFIDRYFSPWNLEVGYQPHQPVPYSHKLHAGLLGLDCRYCHNTVDKTAHAAVPPTETCMNCHDTGRVRSNVPGRSVRLARVLESWKTGDPIPWINVHMLPDFAYFDHSVHVNAGVGCGSCHGRVDHMEIVRQVKPLSMGWCLDCHRHPEKHLRPADRVTDMDYLHADAFDDPEYADTLRDLKAKGADLAALRAAALETGLRLKAERGHNTTDHSRPIYPPTHCGACHR